MNVIKLNRIKYILLVTVSSFLFASCNKDSILINRPNNNVLTIGNYIANNYECSILSEALNYTGLMDTLNNASGAYTLLAADNRSFNKIGILSPADIKKMDRDSLRKVLLFHILPSPLLQGNIPLQQNYPIRTLSGEFLLTSKAESQGFIPSFSGAELLKEKDLYVPGGTFPIGGISLFQYDLPNYKETELANGVVQRIDRPMRPHFNNNVQQWLSNHAEYSIFVAGLKKFDLWDQLANDNEFTIFAPTNASFIKWGFTADVLNNINAQRYNGALLFGAYIIRGRQLLLSDFDYTAVTLEQTFYTDELENAAGYYRFITGDGMTYVNETWRFGYYRNRYLGFAFSLGISKTQEPWGRLANGTQSAEAFLGINDFFVPDPTAWNTGKPETNAIEQLPLGLDRNRSNNLCSNGIVHPFHALAVLPDEALK